MVTISFKNKKLKCTLSQGFKFINVQLITIIFTLACYSRNAKSNLKKQTLICIFELILPVRGQIKQNKRKKIHAAGVKTDPNLLFHCQNTVF